MMIIQIIKLSSLRLIFIILKQHLHGVTNSKIWNNNIKG